MTVWDEFSKAAGNTMRNLGSRARELARITRLESKIANSRMEVERLYCMIGEIYCKKLADGIQNDEHLAALCKNAFVLQREINEMLEEIEVMRQVKRCRYCNEVLKSSSRFCTKCGMMNDDADDVASAAAETPASVKEDDSADENADASEDENTDENVDNSAAEIVTDAPPSKTQAGSGDKEADK